MTPQDVYAMLSGIDENIPVAYYRFLSTADQPAPAPPFICYFYASSDDFYADNINYQRIETLAVELYTDFKDFQLEDRVTAALASHGLSWTKEETYLDDQRMHMTTWTCEVVFTKEE